MERCILALKMLFLIPVMLLFTNCTPESGARFRNPQPTGSKNEAAFSRRFTGIYKNGDATLAVSPTTVVYRSEFELVEHQDSLREFFDFVGDTIIDKESGDKYKAIFKGDSAYWHYSPPFDTMFSMQNGGILKKFKGYYLLNSPADSGFWEVKKLKFLGNKLTVGIITDSADILKLQEITETPLDTANIFNPTRKQFRKYLREQGFANQTVFYRAKN